MDVSALEFILLVASHVTNGHGLEPVSKQGVCECCWIDSPGGCRPLHTKQAVQAGVCKLLPAHKNTPHAQPPCSAHPKLSSLPSLFHTPHLPHPVTAQDHSPFPNTQPSTALPPITHPLQYQVGTAEGYFSLPSQCISPLHPILDKLTALPHQQQPSRPSHSWIPSSPHFILDR